MVTELELRVASGLAVRAEGDAPPRLVGYAAVFNSKSVDLGGFIEIIRPGAFGRHLDKADVRALVNHDPNLILGRTASGTLALTEDDRGLKVTITPPATRRDTIESVERGDLDGMSFGFRALQDRWTFPADPASREPALRELLDVELYDVSVVAFPAYPRTEVALRALEAARSRAAGAGVRLKLETARRRIRFADLERQEPGMGGRELIR